MTRLEKVMKEKKEELKKLLLENYCPSDFGLEDRHDGSEKYCDPATRNCEACWNAEPASPVRIRVCVWCQKDEKHIPLQDCVSCRYSREDDKTVLCSWAPAEKPCEG